MYSTLFIKTFRSKITTHKHYSIMSFFRDLWHSIFNDNKPLTYRHFLFTIIYYLWHRHD